MQHATAKQLLELDLVKPEIWEEYLKFSIVRNPWARALSGYEWLKKKLKVVDSFKNYLYREGKFASALTKSGEINYRGDHLLPQYEYLQIDNKFVVDHIYRLEEINDDIKKIFDDCNINVEKLPVKNVGKYKYKHYSHFYNNTRSDLVRRYYIKDIELFKYSFENKKNEMNYLDQINNMFKHYDLKNRIKYILRYKRVNI